MELGGDGYALSPRFMTCMLTADWFDPESTDLLAENGLERTTFHYVQPRFWDFSHVHSWINILVTQNHSSTSPTLLGNALRDGPTIASGDRL